MKKYLIYLLGLVMMISACKKFEETPKDTVDARLNEKMSAYEAQLASSQFGWKGYLLTGSNLAYVFTFKFNDKNRVVMTANYKAGTPESSYRLKALQLPTLIFDTYSLLHLVSDPDPSVIGGDPGQGFTSDFEFGIVDASADTLHLIGLTNKSKLTLVRATAEPTIADMLKEKEALEAQFTNFKTYFKRAKIGDIDCEVNIDAGTRTFTIGFLEGSVFKTVSSKYYVSGPSIFFFEPLQVGKVKVESLTGINFNSGAGFISAQLSGSEIQIKEAAAPIAYNVTDAPNFLIAPSSRSWWECYNGFTIDGKVDALGIKTIAGFADLDYYVSGANKGNFVCYVGRNFSYFPKMASTISANGYLINTVTATSGSTTNAAAKTIIDNTTNAFIDPQGFYVIRVGSGFDLVAVKDARKWIKFE